MGFVARYAPIPGHLELYVVLVSPFLLLAAPIAGVTLLWRRRWVPAGLACGLTVSIIALQLPWYVASRPDPASVPVRLMTLNMRFGDADPAAVVRVASANADVLMVQEFNPEAARALSAAGIERTFPHQALDARPGASGVGIYSRYAITNSTRIGGYALAMVSAQIRVDHVAHDTTLVTVHFAAPWPQPISGWHSDITKFPGTLSDLAARAGDGSVIVGGDFNSTIDMHPFRELLTDGYRDAAEQAGSGRDLTYPANRGFPPLIGIDHVLARNATAVSTATVELPGTDHRALLATVLVPKQ